MMAAAEVLDEMTRRIVERFAPEEVILFGSRARGDARADSDYDLLVVVDSCDDRRATTIAMRGALADLPASKDIIVATRQDTTRAGNAIVRTTLLEGHRLYARR